MTGISTTKIALKDLKATCKVSIYCVKYIFNLFIFNIKIGFEN
jgi:hypothetical protein